MAQTPRFVVVELFRMADGWRFVGYATYDKRFIDQRVPA